ncbi:hypothetical protein Tco_1563779 [Tanacetum coccineum]
MQTWYFIFDLEMMVQVMQQWYLREDCDDIDPKIDMVHHGGSFTPKPIREYVLGNISIIDLVDIDEFSVHVLDENMKNYVDVLELLKYVPNHKVFLVKVLVDQVKLLGGSSQGGGVKEVNEKGEEVVKKVNVDIQKDGTSYINTVFDTDVMKLVDIVNSSRLDNKLVNVPTEVSESGNDVVIFNEELIELGSKKWNLTVCGQFIGCSMGFNEARYHIRRMWNRLCNTLKITTQRNTTWGATS